MPLKTVTLRQALRQVKGSILNSNNLPGKGVSGSIEGCDVFGIESLTCLKAGRKVTVLRDAMSPTTLILGSLFSYPRFQRRDATKEPTFPYLSYCCTLYTMGL